jgi:hypothetical protein
MSIENDLKPDSCTSLNQCANLSMPRIFEYFEVLFLMKIGIKRMLLKSVSLGEVHIVNQSYFSHENNDEGTVIMIFIEEIRFL